MRNGIILLFGLVSLQLAGQQPILTGPVEPAVRDYLGLTQAQLRAIEALRADILQGQAQRNQRRLEAMRVIQGQTLVADPDAAFLGSAQAELITIDREEAAAWKKLGEDTRKLLTPEQTVRLQPLKAEQELRTLTMQTECQGFLELPKSTSTFGTGGFGIASSASGSLIFFNRVGPCSLVGLSSIYDPIVGQAQKGMKAAILIADPVAQYLVLSFAQSAAISKLREQAQPEQSARESRSIQVRNEIAEESAKDTLDVMALGVRYLELEVIRRESDAARKALTLAIQAELTAEQRAKLAAIEDARKLAELDNFAQAEGFLTPQPPRQPLFLP